MPPKRLGSPTSKTNSKRSWHLSATRSSSTTAQFCPAVQSHPAVQSESLAQQNQDSGSASGTSHVTSLTVVKSKGKTNLQKEFHKRGSSSTSGTSRITSLTVVKSKGKTIIKKESQRDRNVDHAINEDIIIQDTEHLSQPNEIPQYDPEESISIEQPTDPLKSKKHNHKTSVRILF
ncbi:hypothetical protein BDQ17DRAFT_1431453 [Cyathus striatus]|nr:hypothetical protein BDQ17DRAFT_1431453 [Cyathus striatus]